MTKKIHVCICCRNEVNADSFGTIAAALLDGADYWKHRFGKESTFRLKTIARMHVVDARSNLLDSAVNDEADYVLWLDDDMAPTTNVLEQLMEDLDAHPEYDYMGAMCFKKSPPFGPCAFAFVDKKDDPCWIEPEPARIAQVGITGFACLLAKVPAMKAVREATEGQPFIYRRDLGEDGYFFNCAYRIGQKVAVNTGLICGHVGTATYNKSTCDAYRKVAPDVNAKFAPLDFPAVPTPVAVP